MVTPINRKYLWSFAGDITKFLRSAMLTNMMKQLPSATFNNAKLIMNKSYFTHLIYKWNDENSLNREKYIKMLEESIFCHRLLGSIQIPVQLKLSSNVNVFDNNTPFAAPNSTKYPWRLWLNIFDIINSSCPCCEYHLVDSYFLYLSLSTSNTTLVQFPVGAYR